MVLAIIVVLFGAGKLPRVMGDFAKGIKSFKAGMKEADESDAAASPAQLLPSGAAVGSAAPAARVVDGHTGAGQDNLDAVMGPPR